MQRLELRQRVREGAGRILALLERALDRREGVELGVQLGLPRLVADERRPRPGHRHGLAAPHPDEAAATLVHFAQDVLRPIYLATDTGYLLELLGNHRVDLVDLFGRGRRDPREAVRDQLVDAAQRILGVDAGPQHRSLELLGAHRRLPRRRRRARRRQVVGGAHAVGNLDVAGPRDRRQFVEL